MVSVDVPHEWVHLYVIPFETVVRTILFGNPPATVTCGNPPFKTINLFEFAGLKAFVMISLHCNVV